MRPPKLSASCPHLCLRGQAGRPSESHSEGQWEPVAGHGCSVLSLGCVSCPEAESRGSSDSAGSGSSRVALAKTLAEACGLAELFPPPGEVPGRLIAPAKRLIVFSSFCSSSASPSSARVSGATVHVPGGWREPGLGNTPLHWRRPEVRGVLGGGPGCSQTSPVLGGGREWESHRWLKIHVFQRWDR